MTIDAAGLSLKSSNSIILRGGSEAINSNIILSQLIRESLSSCKLPTALVQMIKTTERQAVTELLKMNDYESTSRAKTGGLICLPVKLILSLKGSQNYKSDYFKPLYETGVAYQIQDDLSDFLGTKDRGLPGRDLKEGKMNVLIMHYIDSASDGEKFILQKFKLIIMVP